MKINDLRNAPISFAQLPKLDVAGSSPVARSATTWSVRVYENRLPASAGDFCVTNGPHVGPRDPYDWGPLLARRTSQRWKSQRYSRLQRSQGKRPNAVTSCNASFPDWTSTVLTTQTCARLNGVERYAISADSFARAVAFAISQTDDVDVNEILFRPTRQEG